MPPNPPLVVRSDRLTSDGNYVLVYLLTEGKSIKRHDYHWVDVETDEVSSPMMESQTRAMVWQEGYEYGQKIRKEVAQAEKRKLARRAK